MPHRGVIYVDILTGKTGAVERVDFLNNVPAPIQQRIRQQTLGRHFGVPNHSYRRHVEYEMAEPPKTKH